MKQLILVLPIILILGIGVSSAFGDTLVPEWVKTTALWYAQGEITEQEFLEAIKYLINNNILFLDEKQKQEILDPTITSQEVTVTKPRINQCSVLYQTYKNVGERQFLSKYKHVVFAPTCVKLYKDPVWNYQGEDRLEKLDEKFLQLNQKIKEERSKLSYEPSVNILSIRDIGQGKFDIKFNICAGDTPIDKAKVLVKSKIEAIQVGSNKDIPANVCRTYVTEIHANNSANIEISFLERTFLE